MAFAAEQKNTPQPLLLYTCVERRREENERSNGAGGFFPGNFLTLASQKRQSFPGPLSPVASPILPWDHRRRRRGEEGLRPDRSLGKRRTDRPSHRPRHHPLRRSQERAKKRNGRRTAPLSPTFLLWRVRVFLGGKKGGEEPSRDHLPDMQIAKMMSIIREVHRKKLKEKYFFLHQCCVRQSGIRLEQCMRHSLLQRFNFEFLFQVVCGFPSAQLKKVKLKSP